MSETTIRKPTQGRRGTEILDYSGYAASMGRDTSRFTQEEDEIYRVEEVDENMSI